MSKDTPKPESQGKAEVKPEAKPEVKSEAKPEGKAEAKTEDKGPAEAAPASSEAPLNDTASEALAAFESDEKTKEKKAAEAKKEKEEAEEEARQARESLRRPGLIRGFFRGFFQIRDSATIWGKIFMVLACLSLIGLVWYLSSRPWWGPEGNERALNRMAMGSPEEVFGNFHSLWFERALMRNLFASLWRVAQGFGLAVLVGIPLGILCGAFTRVDAFFAPISLFGRNVPIAALVPVTLLFFGIGEGQKVAFIFMACVAFILFDASRAIRDVKNDYLDTAYTLGANRFQVLTKVMVPLAMPDIFNSVRLLFGLAFGYIILAEMVNAELGIGRLILTSQRRGMTDDVPLILIFLTLVAFFIDRGLFMIQRTLFSYRYGRR